MYENLPGRDSRQISIHADARHRLRRAAAVSLARVVGTEQKIERRLRIIDRVPPQPAAVNRPQIQILQLVMRKIAAPNANIFLVMFRS